MDLANASLMVTADVDKCRTTMCKAAATLSFTWEARKDGSDFIVRQSRFDNRAASTGQ